MKVLILGADGYIGRALGHYLESKDVFIYEVDSLVRRDLVKRIKSQSIYPVPEYTGEMLDVSWKLFQGLFVQFCPDVVVHLAEIPSAPYSMVDARKCIFTQANNIAATLNVLWCMRQYAPNCHMIKLGTAGEYSDFLYDSKIIPIIPEGSRIKVEYQGNPEWEIPTPRMGASFYHMSKLHDSNNIDYACRIWNLRVTDVNQGPVYGHLYDTRFDVDEQFGTVVNRFCAQAVAGIPMSIYGIGQQVRGYINLQNSLEAIWISAQNPPTPGEFRVIHQVTEEKSVLDIAECVQDVVQDAKIEMIDNPRVEMEKNNFKFERKFLSDFGLKTIKMEDSIEDIINMIRKYRYRIIPEVITPKTTWR